jgi:hypothetical protein
MNKKLINYIANIRSNIYTERNKARGKNKWQREENIEKSKKIQ